MSQDREGLLGVLRPRPVDGIREPLVNVFAAMFWIACEEHFQIDAAAAYQGATIVVDVADPADVHRWAEVFRQPTDELSTNVTRAGVEITSLLGNVGGWKLHVTCVRNVPVAVPA